MFSENFSWIAGCDDGEVGQVSISNSCVFSNLRGCSALGSLGDVCVLEVEPAWLSTFYLFL